MLHWQQGWQIVLTKPGAQQHLEWEAVPRKRGKKDKDATVEDYVKAQWARQRWVSHLQIMKH